MIQISKAEKEIVNSQYPELKVVRTCRQKSNRHRYYLVEDERALRLIAPMNVCAAELVEAIDARKRRDLWLINNNS
jgi:hypothetical protein